MCVTLLSIYELAAAIEVRVEIIPINPMWNNLKIRFDSLLTAANGIVVRYKVILMIYKFASISEKT